MPTLIAEEGKDTNVGPNEAEQLLQGIADALGVEPGHGDARPSRIRRPGS